MSEFVERRHALQMHVRLKPAVQKHVQLLQQVQIPAVLRLLVPRHVQQTVVEQMQPEPVHVEQMLVQFRQLVLIGTLFRLVEQRLMQPDIVE